MKPRVLIDASPVTNMVDGLAVYIVNLIKHLPAESFERFDYTVLLNPGVEWPDLTAALQARPFAVLRERIAPIGPRRDWDMWRFRRRHRGAFDFVHITSNNYPFGMRGGIGTIHDVTFKGWFEGRRGIPGYATLARLYMVGMIRNCLRSADAIIAVSQSSQDEVARLFGVTADERAKFHVFHEGWEHLADYETGVCDDSPGDLDGYLFFLGSHRPHKNLEKLLEGFRLASDRIPPDKRLVIGGSSEMLSPASRRLADTLGSRLRFAGYLSNACVREYYRHADAFIFPSLSEGFGIPVLEAFHFGTPLLCSKATALPEVAGDAALYFDPASAEAIADAIVRFYADPALAARLREAGRQRLKQFSWARMAEQIVMLYQAMTAGSQDRTD